MADLSFAQPARRNLLLPIGIAAAVLAIAIGLVVSFTPHRVADVAVVQTRVYNSHLVFKSNSIVVGRDQAEDDLYVFATLRITNRLRLPLFLKDFTATLQPGDGTAALTASAVEKPDLANLYASFPALGKMAAEQGPMLFRETRIEPGQTAEGAILLHFGTTEDVWKSRQDATIAIDLYHQQPLTVAIPKTAATGSMAH